MIGKIVFLGFLFILLIIALAYALSIFARLIWGKGVPYVPLTKKQLKAINKHIRLKSNDKIVDLGCGDGRVLRMFEKQGIKDLTGYEMDVWVYLLAKIKNKILKSKSKIYLRNFKKVNLSEYNIIFCYLSGYYMNSLKEKFDKELKPGTKIISYAFQTKNWREPRIIYTNKKNEKLGRIFIYIIN